MDLVDIDQVLDNLELCEAADESRAAAAASTRPMLAINEGTQINGLNNASSAHKGNNATAQKSFVGVSQVFNSLDDYCNNVKSLASTTISQQYDEECRPITTHTTMNSGNVETTQSLKSYVNESYDDDDDEEEEDEELACSDINKFKEERRHKWEEDNDNIGSSSDSLTTSSSSSFSSGPSPVAVSTTDDNSTYVSLINVRNIEEDAEVSNNESVEESPELQTEAELKVNDEADSLSVPVEDIAQGMSTISLTASTTANSQLILPCESNVSSALKNVLDQLSDTESSSLLSQQADEEPKLQENVNETKEKVR